MNTRILAALALSLLVLSPLAGAEADPQGTKLTGAELNQLTTPAVMLVGRNVVFRFWFSAAYAREGNVFKVFIEESGHADQAKGSWRVSGDSLCTTFPLSTPPTEQCRSIFKLSDGSYEGRSIPEGWRFEIFRAQRLE
jgi:hypothetical protein